MAPPSPIRPNIPCGLAVDVSHLGFRFSPSSGPLSRINFTLDATWTEAVRGYAHEHLVTEPGKKYSYSNMGIATLGRIIEVVSGEEYSRFVQVGFWSRWGCRIRSSIRRSPSAPGLR